MNIKGSADKGTRGDKEYITKNWRKEDSFYLASGCVAGTREPRKSRGTGKLQWRVGNRYLKSGDAWGAC